MQLKKNVYQNYGQFIDTAKEISFLESEMYQLAHMITEQRNLLHELMDASVLGDKVIMLCGTVSEETQILDFYPYHFPKLYQCKSMFILTAIY